MWNLKRLKRGKGCGGYYLWMLGRCPKCKRKYANVRHNKSKQNNNNKTPTWSTVCHQHLFSIPWNAFYHFSLLRTPVAFGFQDKKLNCFDLQTTCRTCLSSLWIQALPHILHPLVSWSPLCLMLFQSPM